MIPNGDPSGAGCRHIRTVSLLQGVVVVIVGSVPFRGLLRSRHVVQLLTGGGSSCGCCSSGQQRRFAVAVFRWGGIAFEFRNLRWICRLTATQIALQKSGFPVGAAVSLPRDRGTSTRFSISLGLYMESNIW